MDLLFKRYASPFFLLDEMIENIRFDAFIDQIIKKTNEENEHQVYWEYYLHKVHTDISFNDFVEQCKAGTVNDQVDVDFGTTIDSSYNILVDFIPE